MARVKHEIESGAKGSGAKPKKDWWFGMWQPDTVVDPKTRKKMPFQDAPLDLLRDTPSAWVLHPGEKWQALPVSGQLLHA